LISMKKVQFFIILIVLMFLEQYLRLVFSWPIVLVPGLILAFLVMNTKNRGNLGVVLTAIFLYDFWGSNVPGVSIIVLVGILMLVYALGSRVDFGGSFLFSALATLVASTIYLFAVSGLDGFFLQKTIPDFTIIVWPSVHMLALVLIEAICVIAIVNVMRIYKFVRMQRIKIF